MMFAVVLTIKTEVKFSIIAFCLFLNLTFLGNPSFGQAIYTLIYGGDTESVYALLSSQYTGPWTDNMVCFWFESQMCGFQYLNIQVESQYNNPNLHVVATYPRESYAATASSCSSNSNLKIDTDTDTGTDTGTDTNPHTSAAWSVMSVNVVMVVLALVVVFL